jgi:hypothetical protein
MKKTVKTQDFGKLVKSIERSNAKFATANRPQRIVMVAKDVLALLTLKRIKARQGNYVKMDKVPENLNIETNDDGTCQLQDLLKMAAMPTCSVCAIGSAMIASTLRLNEVSVSKSSLTSDYGSLRYFFYTDDDDSHARDTEDQMSKRARDVFPEDLLRYMEQAFETGNYGYYRLSSAKGRLVAIYQNLVDNKGERFTEYKSKKVVFPDSETMP